MNQVDLNTISIGVANHIFDTVVEGATSTIANASKHISQKTKKELQGYAQSILERTSFVKTIVHPDESMHIDDIYVPLSYYISEELTSDTAIFNEFRSGARILIFGTAGGGKSVLIKKMCSDMLRDHGDRIPIFYELRYLNGLQVGLGQAVFESIKRHAPSIDHDTFNSMLKSGRFGLVLDGYDEIDHDKRQDVGREIDELISANPSLSVAVTSRPEDHLPGLSAFSVYRAARMSKAQALSLIGKIDYDQEKKSSFMARVDEELYELHLEFMSIPLMISMMLLTYSYYSEIPAKIHIFYRQAFDVLCQRHDRSKGVYTRKSYSGLSPDDFGLIFSYFCAATYVLNRYEFSEGEAKKYIKEAVGYYGFNIKVGHVLSDVIESTCLLQKDGVDITFVHRSFQEYFTAVFISSLGEDEARMMIEPLTARAASDSVVAMMFEMDSSFLERAWVVPTINKMLESVDNGGIYALVPDVFDKIHIDNERITPGNADTLAGNEAMALWMLYGLHLVVDEMRMPEEPVWALTNVSAENNIEEEFLSFCTSQEIYYEFKQTGKVVVHNPDDAGIMLLLDDVSEDVLNAALVDMAIKREVDAWRNVKERIDRLNRGRGLSIASLLKSVQ